MTPASPTATAAFTARLLHSELWRVRVLALVLVFTLVTTVVRRALGGVVMTDDDVFYPTVGVLLVGLVYQGVTLRAIRRRERLGGTIPVSQWLVGVAVELAVPTALLLILLFNSPRGEYAAVSAPAVLLFPLTTLLAVLRLRPWCAAGTGVAAGLIHFALVGVALARDHIPPDHLPVLFSYGVLLGLTGGAAGVVSRLARRYVTEAVAEATASERAAQDRALIERDLRMAREIQMGLLPTERPTIAGFDIAGMSRPAAQAGGDYYDWQPLADGRLVVALADVSGHGIGPALVTAVCRAYSRASAPTNTDPGALLGRLNHLIFEDVKGARFITMIVGVLSSDGEVRMLSAGHGPTLLYRAATGRVESFGGDGLPLGIIADESYGPPREVRLEPGDVLLLLTDGFMEYARGDGEQFGEERLVAALTAHAAEPAADLIAALDRAVGEFAAGAPQADDMTAVVVKRH